MTISQSLKMRWAKPNTHTDAITCALAVAGLNGMRLAVLVNVDVAGAGPYNEPKND